jgi:hypothetical protein
LFDPSDDRSKLHKAIEYRHDCVHRNGIDRDGKRLEVFTRQYVQGIADDIKMLVDKIEAKAKRDRPRGGS